MSASTSSSSTGGIGFGGALFLVFLVLKLTGVIAWSWLWVTAPLWIPLAIAVLFFAIGGLILGVASALDSREDRKRRERAELARRTR